jgi:phenylacetate-CoA ligase
MYPYQVFDLYKLLRTQWKPPEVVKKIQEKKLKKLVNHAYQNVPYYRELFDSLKIKPQDIRTLEDLQMLPFTSKKQIQALSLEERTAKNFNIKHCKSFITSGATGAPLRTFHTFQYETLKNFNCARAYLTSGMKFWYKMVAFSGEQSVNEKKPWHEYFMLWRRKEISNWDIAEIWIDKLREWKPHVLTGEIITLKLLGEAVQKYQIKDISPKIIFTASSIMDDFSRQYLQSVFRAKIVDIYGSVEGGFIAWECEKCSGYHICSDVVIVEILKNGNPVSSGQRGEVVITNLHSYAMPFIRYRQEDIVTLSNKKPICGRSFPLLGHIDGRTDDFIVLKNGRKISPHPLYHCVVSVQGVKRWRMVQENMNMLRVDIEPTKNFTNESQQRIESNLKKLVGDEIEIKISLVDSILVDLSSKFRTVSSKVSGNF